MFYHFGQNNSGGSFSFDAKRGISHHVIIEANSTSEANNRAESIGLYFSGCDSGLDCSCCGDRWYKLWTSEKGTKKPSIYDVVMKPNSKFPTKKDSFVTKWINGPEGYIHYADGTFKPFWL